MFWNKTLKRTRKIVMWNGIWVIYLLSIIKKKRYGTKKFSVFWCAWDCVDSLEPTNTKCECYAIFLMLSRKKKLIGTFVYRIDEWRKYKCITFFFNEMCILHNLWYIPEGRKLNVNQSLIKPWENTCVHYNNWSW